MKNKMILKVQALSVNESFARSTVGAFCVQANPSVDEITDIKTAVSEAVTNSVVHAYPYKDGEIEIEVIVKENGVIKISVKDFGVGIDDVEQAMQPFYTTKANEERSGMGFTVMESFMDKVLVKKNKNGGTTVVMEKKVGNVNYSVIGG